MKSNLAIGLLLACLVWTGFLSAAEVRPSPDRLMLHMRSRQKKADADGRHELVYKTAQWEPKKTAIIICDMWNTLCCKIPADRVAEMAVRMNEVVAAARRRGVLIIHSPSGNVDFYEGTPQRKLAQQAPKVETTVPLKWCYLDPKREPPLPIDDSKGGWEGPRLPGRPQTRQHEAIKIEQGDAVGAGRDVFYLIQQRGIENVIVMGVHTNMCVLGRPFGIRQMVYLGKNVALMRDMTDSLYNPEFEPRVNHFRGTELVVEHIEKHWCPTLTSCDFLDKPAFRFKQDKRPHIVFVVNNNHYEANQTMPRFAQQLREKCGYSCTVLNIQDESSYPGMEELRAADCMVLFVRRRALPAGQMAIVRRYVASGGPVVALRTASHAFAVGKLPEGYAQWKEFDHDVLGGNYHGHGSNKLGTDVAAAAGAVAHPILAGVAPGKWHSTGSLYDVSPIDRKAVVLQTGSQGDRTEPLSWARRHGDCRVFYTGLGHPDDFNTPQFRKLLENAIRWALDKE